MDSSNRSTIKTIVTVGPSTRTMEDLLMIKDKQVDFVRVNMAHSDIEELQYFIDESKKAGLEFILDTEGSQLRTGDLNDDCLFLEEGSIVKSIILLLTS